VHYRLGMELESAMCQGMVSRKHSAILWLVHSSADPDGWVSRKTIESNLSQWFEISNSNISRLIRELTSEPTLLLDLAENPNSGRERMLRLTDSGRRFVEGMIAAAVDYLGAKLGHLESDELAWGLRFFKLAFGYDQGPEAGDRDLDGPVIGAETPQRAARIR
jgi:DNA-binding MarR family transcriptional regulator